MPSFILSTCLMHIAQGRVDGKWLKKGLSEEDMEDLGIKRIHRRKLRLELDDLMGTLSPSPAGSAYVNIQLLINN